MEDEQCKGESDHVSGPFSSFACCWSGRARAHAHDDVGRAIESQYGVYPDFATTLRVEYIGHRVALAAGLPNTTFHIFDGNETQRRSHCPMDASLSPAAWRPLLTDDELAFVFGHELTHVKEHHAFIRTSK